MRDGELVGADPDGIIGYVAVPLAEWMKDPGYA